MGKFGRGVQNFSYQAQDFVVQVSGGTSALRALGQQLPQALGSFGLLGAAVGIVAASLPIVITLFKNMGSESLNLSGSITLLEDSLKGLNESGVHAAQDITDKFNVAFQAIAENKARVAIETVRAEFQSLTATTKEVSNGFLGLFAAGEGLLAQSKMVEGWQRLGKALNLSDDNAKRLDASLTELANSAPEKLTQNAQKTLAIMAEIANVATTAVGPEFEQLEKDVRLTATNAATLASNTGGANAAAVSLLTTWGSLAAAAQSTAGWAAAAASATARATQQAANMSKAVSSIRGGAGTAFGGKPGSSASDFSVSGIPGFSGAASSSGFDNLGTVITEAPSLGGGGGGGGGLSDEAKELKKHLDELKSSAEAVFANTRTPAEAFAIQMRDINELLTTGNIDLVTWDRAVAQAKQTLAEAGEEGSDTFRNFSDDFGDAVSSIVQGTSSIGEAFSDLFAQISGDLISSGITSALSGLFGAAASGGKPASPGLFSGFLGAMGIKTYASGTRYAAGGLSLVGEAGPELINLRRGAQVHPNGSFGGNVVTFAPTIHAPGADAAGLQQVRSEMQAQFLEFKTTFRDNVANSNRDHRYRGRV
jgi:hypothetical protein